jgi:hypothetical protein
MSFKKDNLATQVNSGLVGPSTFEGDLLSVFYTTTTEALIAILPPGLQLRGQPIVELELNDFHKTNVDIPYKEAAMLICVTEERTKIPGRFVVAMTLSSDVASFLGREARGFPKKVGHVGGKWDGKEQFPAYCARHGICYASYAADCSKPPNDKEGLKVALEQFTVPARPDVDATSSAVYNYIWPVGVRSLMKPLLQPMWLTCTPLSQSKLGLGQVTLNMSKHDPWACLPVVKILGATITTATMSLVAGDKQYNTEVDPKAFLPYSFAGWDEPQN